MAARNSHDRASWRRAISRASLKDASAVRGASFAERMSSSSPLTRCSSASKVQLSCGASDGEALFDSRQCVFGTVRLRQRLGEQP